MAVGGSGEARLGTAVASLVSATADMRADKRDLEAKRSGLVQEKSNADDAAREAEIQAEIDLVDRQISDYETSITLNEDLLKRAEEGEAEAIALITSPAAARHASTISPATAQAVSAAVRDITLRTIGQNYMPQMCVELLRLNNARRAELDTICVNYLMAYTHRLVARMESMDAALLDVLADDTLSAQERRRRIAAIQDMVNDDPQRASMVNPFAPGEPPLAAGPN